MKHSYLLAMIGSVWAWLPSPTEASTILAMSMTDLAKQADVIVHGVVVRKKSRYSAGRVVTECTLQVEEVAYGAVTPGQRVTVLLLGGEVGDVGMRVVGEPSCGHVGDKVVVAATGKPNALRPLGMSQGWFPVRNNLVQPSGDGLHRLNAPNSGPGKAAYQQSEAIMSGPEDVHSFVDRFRSLARQARSQSGALLSSQPTDADSAEASSTRTAVSNTTSSRSVPASAPSSTHARKRAKSDTKQSSRAR